MLLIKANIKELNSPDKNIFTYSRLLFSHRKEENATICDNIVETEGIMLGEMSQTNKYRNHWPK